MILVEQLFKMTFTIISAKLAKKYVSCGANFSPFCPVVACFNPLQSAQNKRADRGSRPGVKLVSVCNKEDTKYEFLTKALRSRETAAAEDENFWLLEDTVIQ